MFRRGREKPDAHLSLPSLCHAKWERSLDKAVRLNIARRWIPSDALTAQWDRVQARMP